MLRFLFCALHCGPHPPPQWAAHRPPVWTPGLPNPIRVCEVSRRGVPSSPGCRSGFSPFLGLAIGAHFLVVFFGEFGFLISNFT